MRYLSLFLILLSIGSLLSLPGCLDDKIVEGTGRIQYVDLEGGFYGIVADDGAHYDPVNLPEDFMENGLRVRFTLRILDDQVSIHMWGTVVYILEIEKI